MSRHYKLSIILILLTLMSLFAALRMRAAAPLLSSRAMGGLPQTMLWAWERAENLQFIDPQTMGVAYLAKTIYLRGDQVVVKPRLQPLNIPQNTIVMPVVRIEAGTKQHPFLSPAQLKTTIAAICPLVTANTTTIQIDFDATVSERGFYRQLLQQLRSQLPPNVAISITALASWTTYDGWLKGLPIDEAVPMLFRMSTDRPQILARLRAHQDFSYPVCRTSIGMATDEALPWLPSGRRIYIFAAQNWTPALLQETLRKAKQWQSAPQFVD